MRSPSHLSTREILDVERIETIEMHEVEISRLAGRRQSGDTDHVEGEQVEEGVKTAQLRAEIEKLKQDHADHERTLVAEIAQLRGEVEQLKQAQPGSVMSLGVAAEAAVATTTMDDGVTSLKWFYADADGSGTIHGPFALSQIQTWHAEGHFDDDRELYLGKGGDPITLMQALQDAGLVADAGEGADAEGADADGAHWFYAGPDGSGIMHGPYALSEMNMWRIEGHFDDDCELHFGKDGAPITLKEALRDAGLLTDADILRWFYPDDDGSGAMLGPFSLRMMKGWHTDGHFTDDLELHLGEEGGATTLGEALHDGGL